MAPAEDTMFDTPVDAGMDLEDPGFQAPADMEDDEVTYGMTEEVGKDINVTPDGGVVKKILVKGDGWEKPETHDIVTVHYVGTLTDGTQFDSSRERGDPFTFNLGEGSVIKGWDLGVATMKKGEKAVLTCKAEYAYGEAGSPPKIPPGATLNFEVELLSWRSVKDISGDGGVIKKVLQEGEGWQKPNDRDEVKVVFSAKVQGTEQAFKASGPEGVEFTLSEGLEGLAGVVTALKTMKTGEHAAVTLQPSYAYGAAGNAELGVPADATIEVDLQLVSWKKVEDVTADGGVVRKVLAESTRWEVPNEGATVSVVLTAKLEDGTVVASYPEGQELTWVTDEELMLEGLEAGVMKMKVEEHAMLTVSPQYGFGDAGSPATPEGEALAPETAKLPAGLLRLCAPVPPGATLVFDVRLVKLEKAKESWEMSDPEKVDAAAARKEKANKAYREGKTQRAVKLYDKAAAFISYDKSFPDELKVRARDVRKAVQLNLAAAHLKLKNWKVAAEQAGKVLEVEPANLKALYRHAEALMGSGDYVEAEQDIKKGLLEQPDSADLTALHKKLKLLMRDQAKKEAALYSKMFKFPASKAKPAAAADAAPAAAAADAAGPMDADQQQDQQQQQQEVQQQA